MESDHFIISYGSAYLESFFLTELSLQFNSIQFNSVYWPIKGPQGATGKLYIDGQIVETKSTFTVAPLPQNQKNSKTKTTKKKTKMYNTLPEGSNAQSVDRGFRRTAALVILSLNKSESN